MFLTGTNFVPCCLLATFGGLLLAFRKYTTKEEMRAVEWFLAMAPLGKISLAFFAQSHVFWTTFYYFVLPRS